jgi:hypothetical protein
VTVVAQWAKAPGIHCYVAGSIPAITPRYCTKKIEKMLFGAQKNKGKKNNRLTLHRRYFFYRESSLNASSPLLLKVTLPTSG